MSNKRLNLTALKVEGLTAGVSRTELKKAIDDCKLDEKWNKTGWAIKQAKTLRRRNLTDFDRFKVMTLRKRVFIINK